MCILNVLNYMLLLLSRKKRYEKNTFFSFNWRFIHDGNIFSIYFFIKSTSAKIFSILNLFVVIYSTIITFFRIIGIHYIIFTQSLSKYLHLYTNK